MAEDAAAVKGGDLPPSHSRNASGTVTAASPDGDEDPSAYKADEYASERELGRGAFGKVMLVKRKSDGKPFVVKSLFISEETMTPEEIFDAENELHVLGILSNHPNITSLVDYYKNSEGYHIVLEYANENTLNERIIGWREKKMEWDEGEVLDIFCQLCLAMDHCHTHNILHRDIKPANIMLTKLRPEDVVSSHVPVKSRASPAPTAGASAAGSDGGGGDDVPSTTSSAGIAGGDGETTVGDAPAGAGGVNNDDKKKRGGEKVDDNDAAAAAAADDADADADAAADDDDDAADDDDDDGAHAKVGSGSRGGGESGVGRRDKNAHNDRKGDAPPGGEKGALAGDKAEADDSPRLDASSFEPFLLVKLGDFGLSRELKPGAKAHTYVGTPHYISPEVVEGRSYEYQSDVWALGCCLYEMLMGKRPFDSGHKDRQKLRLAIAQGEYDRVPTERCSGQLRRLVEKCLSYMPEDRPSLSEILEVSCVRNTVRGFREKLADLADVGVIAEEVANFHLGGTGGGGTHGVHHGQTAKGGGGGGGGGGWARERTRVGEGDTSDHVHPAASRVDSFDNGLGVAGMDNGDDGF